jgi:hypothetical protein
MKVWCHTDGGAITVFSDPPDMPILDALRLYEELRARPCFAENEI